MSNRTWIHDALIRGFASGRKLDILDIGGQTIFPIYAQDGGLACKYVMYFRRPNHPMPRDGEPLGLESSHHPSVWPVELHHDASVDEAIQHLEQRIAFEESEAEREATINSRTTV